VEQGDPFFDWGWASRHLDDVATKVLAHLVLTGLAVGIGLLISLVLAVLIVRYRWLDAPITWTTGILYTIPSLALFALLVPFWGFSLRTAEVGLVSYTLLILIRNIVAGLRGVPADVREAAVGMGYSPAQVLLRVDLPLALPVIVAGVRIATVTTIGLVTVTAIIGRENLGQFILEGINQLFSTKIVLGAALSIALAVAADLLLLGVQWLAAPWLRSRGRPA
jgi:osmoprotectant transport system permease protein